MTDNELPPSYPACFEGPQQFDGWRDSARRVSEESNPCDDCTAEYAARMRTRAVVIVSTSKSALSSTSGKSELEWWREEAV